jgi:xanthine dehydrogenase molybdopterin-binding subunit B
MSDSSAECRARAAALRATYGDSPLANVRDRYEAAAAKWDVMALQAERTDKGRLARAEKRVAGEMTLDGPDDFYPPLRST